MGPYGQAQDKKKEGDPCFEELCSRGTSRTILFCSRVSFEKNIYSRLRRDLVQLSYITVEVLQHFF